jgi:hypothetical protein
MIKKIFLYLFLIFVFSSVVSSQIKQRVKFAKNSSSASVKGAVRGYDYIDYIVGSRAGQKISLKLSAAKTFPVFTVSLPNGENLEDAIERDQFSAELPETGDYVVRVFMMRAAARRKNSIAAYTLKISIN